MQQLQDSVGQMLMPTRGTELLQQAERAHGSASVCVGVFLLHSLFEVLNHSHRQL